jgi:hypothetical protein
VNFEYEPTSAYVAGIGPCRDRQRERKRRLGG